MYWVDSKVSKDMQKIFVKIPGSSSCLLIRNYEMLKSTIVASGSTSYFSVLFWIRLQILSSLLFEVNEVDKVEFKRSFRGCERLEDWHVLSGRKIYLTKQHKRSGQTRLLVLTGTETVNTKTDEMRPKIFIQRNNDWEWCLVCLKYSRVVSSVFQLSSHGFFVAACCMK